MYSARYKEHSSVFLHSIDLQNLAK